MKRTMITLSVLCGAPLLADTFDFGQCSGSGTFEQQIHKFQNYEDSVTVGEIPSGIQGLRVELVSSNDVDIRLYGHQASGAADKIVHWPYGLLKQAYLEHKPYEGVEVTYSGYNGVGGQLGHEYIEISGATPVAMTMKAFGYQAGFATVNYSWTGKNNCTPNETGSGHFLQDVPQKATALVGKIPAGISNLSVSLDSDSDLDIQLYGSDGTAIASWSPTGLIAGPAKQSIDFMACISNGQERDRDVQSDAHRKNERDRDV